ncbi:MAG: hypothetical protein A2W29_09480, partial [Gemmatimonadetes bacterium RBG_16_66_8]
WILEGSAAACRELHNRYETRVFKAILGRVRNPADASDLTQTTFQKVYGELATFDQERPFAPWLFTIAKNATIDHLRKERHEARTSQKWLDQTSDGWRLKEGIPANEESSSPRIDREAFNQAMARAREHVNRTNMECFRLHFVEERSYAKIGKKLHLTEGTARSYASRARKKLENM